MKPNKETHMCLQRRDYTLLGRAAEEAFSAEDQDILEVEFALGWGEAKVPLGAGCEVCLGQVGRKFESWPSSSSIGKYGQYLGKYN